MGRGSGGGRERKNKVIGEEVRVCEGDIRASGKSLQT